MKKVAGPIENHLAQYRGSGCFANSGPTLIKLQRKSSCRVKRLMETLKQPQYSPIPVEHQVIILYVATNRYLMDIDVKQVRRFNTELVKFMDESIPRLLGPLQRLVN
jgi:F-type H+-transporting ATPase subunit alpha